MSRSHSLRAAALATAFALTASLPLRAAEAAAENDDAPAGAKRTSGQILKMGSRVAAAEIAPASNEGEQALQRMKLPPKPWAIGKHLEVMNTTGPNALSKTLAKSDQVFGTLPTTLLTPCSICNVDSCNKHNHDKLMRQLTGKSWHALDSTFYNFIFCYKWYIVAAIAAMVAVFVAQRYLL